MIKCAACGHGRTKHTPKCKQGNDCPCQQFQHASVDNPSKCPVSERELVFFAGWICADCREAIRRVHVPLDQLQAEKPICRVCKKPVDGACKQHPNVRPIYYDDPT